MTHLYLVILQRTASFFKKILIDPQNKNDLCLSIWNIFKKQLGGKGGLQTTVFSSVLYTLVEL